jgi:hypothetical protein
MSGLETLSKLRPVTFSYKPEIGIEGEQLGFIAEEVASVDPRLVVFDGEHTPFSVKYENMTSVLAKAIQELHEKHTTLDLRVANMEALLSFASTTEGQVSQSIPEIVFAYVLEKLADFGLEISQGMAYLKSVFVENLTIGSQEKPSGITIYDEVTGEPYCMKMRNGALVSLAGSCADSAEAPAGDAPPSEEGGGDGEGSSGVPAGDTDSGSDSGSDSASGSGSDTGTATTTSAAPAVSILGANPATITIGTSYVDLGATVTDVNPDGTVNTNLGLHFTVNGVSMSEVSIDTSTSTTHTIIYTATDGEGNSGTATRIVNVVPVE